MKNMLILTILLITMHAVAADYLWTTTPYEDTEYEIWISPSDPYTIPHGEWPLGPDLLANDIARIYVLHADTHTQVADDLAKRVVLTAQNATLIKQGVPVPSFLDSIIPEFWLTTRTLTDNQGAEFDFCYYWQATDLAANWQLFKGNELFWPDVKGRRHRIKLYETVIIESLFQAFPGGATEIEYIDTDGSHARESIADMSHLARAIHASEQLKENADGAKFWAKILELSSGQPLPVDEVKAGFLGIAKRFESNPYLRNLNDFLLGVQVGVRLAHADAKYVAYEILSAGQAADRLDALMTALEDPEFAARLDAFDPAIRLAIQGSPQDGAEGVEAILAEYTNTLASRLWSDFTEVAPDAVYLFVKKLAFKGLLSAAGGPVTILLYINYETWKSVYDKKALFQHMSAAGTLSRAFRQCENDWVSALRSDVMNKPEEVTYLLCNFTSIRAAFGWSFFSSLKDYYFPTGILSAILLENEIYPEWELYEYTLIEDELDDCVNAMDGLRPEFYLTWKWDLFEPVPSSELERPYGAIWTKLRSQPVILLTDGQASKTSGGHNFYVTYSNTAGNPPEYVCLVLSPGGRFDMAKLDLQDDEYTNGCIYYLAKTLNPNSYSFYFEASEGITTARDPHVEEYQLTVGSSASQFEIWADPDPVDTMGTTVIYARVLTGGGAPVEGDTVTFEGYQPGRFFDHNGPEPATSITNEEGIATIKYTPYSAGTAVIHAETEGGLDDSITITVNPGETLILIDVTPGAPGENYDVKVTVTDRASGTPLQNKPVSFSLEPSTRGDILNASAATNPGGEAYCDIRPLEDGLAALTVTYELTAESSTQHIYLQKSVSSSFTGFAYCGLGGTDVDWNYTGDLIAFVSDKQLVLIDNLPLEPANWGPVKLLDTNICRATVFSPEGERVFVAGGTGSDERSMWVHNFPTGSLTRDWGYNSTGQLEDRAVDWVKNRIALGWKQSGNNAFVFIDSSSGTQLCSWATTGNDEARAVAINPLNQNVAAAVDGDSAGRVYEFTCSSLTEKGSLGTPGTCAAWLPTGQYIAIGGRDKVIIYDSSFSQVATLGGHGSPIYGVSFSRDSRWLVTAADDKTNVIEVGTWMPFRSGPGGRAVAWDPTSTYYVTNSGEICAPFDATGPIIRDLWPPDGHKTTADSITVSGDISDPIGISGAEITVNGGVAQALTLDDDTGHFEHAVSLNVDLNTITITATDRGSAETPIDLLITRLPDTTAPRITDITVVPPEGEIGTAFTVTTTVTDDHSQVDADSVICTVQQPDSSVIATLQMYDDGTHGDPTADDSVFTALWDSSSSIEAIHYLDFSAQDTEGNSRNVDNGGNLDLYDLPIISYNPISPTHPTDVDDVTISAQITDTASVASVFAWYSPGQSEIWRPLLTTSENDTFYTTIPAQDPNIIYYYFSASDAFGHNVKGAHQSYLTTRAADIDQDGDIDKSDLALLVWYWGTQTCSEPNWCQGADFDRDGSVGFSELAILAAHWLEGVAPPHGSDIIFMPIADEGFTGEMSKYETTNAQYCKYLNAAKASGEITVSINGDEVYGSSGPYDSEIYYDMHSSDAQISYSESDGKFSVEPPRDGYDMSDHPVVEVSWYGAMAFAEYYGWRLPTEWEWQAVADYDGSYTYGCGTTIDQSKANYYDSGYANPLKLSSSPYTSPVGYYGDYGYDLCDIAGNVWEWTSSIYDGSARVLRGGSWGGGAGACAVSYQGYDNASYTVNNIGFRVCR